MADLPILKILWAPSNAAHWNHLHVEGWPKRSGRCTSIWTPAVEEIWDALDERFPGWTNMGVYNCRNIAGTNTPSQHSYSNAIDIGPYYGVAEQQKFYDFLTGKEEKKMEISKPSWLGQAVLDRMAVYGVVPRPQETEDMWRFIAFMDRVVTKLASSGGASQAQLNALVGAFNDHKHPMGRPI